MKDLFPPPFINRYKDKGTRDKESKNEWPVDTLGADKDDVAKYNPKEDEEKGLWTVEVMTGHGILLVDDL